MFLFKPAQKNLPHPVSVYHNLTYYFRVYQRVSAFLFCLFTAFLAVSCNTDTNDDRGFIDDHKLNSDLIGIWTSEYGDSYTITGNYLSYGYGGILDYAGTIRYVSNFTNSAGVFIIEYDSDKKPAYYEDGHWEDAGHIIPPNGDFIGIYYKNLKSGVSVSIGGAYVDGGAEKPTLDEAKNTFTSGNEGSYMGFYGVYTK
jgi:hypothetical protein